MADASLRYGSGVFAKENRERGAGGLSRIGRLGDILDDIRVSREVFILICAFLYYAWYCWMDRIVSTS